MQTYIQSPRPEGIMSQLSATEKLFGTTTLDERQAALARKTYALLGISASGAIAGGYLGATSPVLVGFFSSPIGWLLALITINLVPRLALWASRKDQATGIALLAADGFISGLVLAPILALCRTVAPDILPAAMGVTLAAFVAVTGYLMVSRKRFSAPAGLLTGMFVSLMA